MAGTHLSFVILSNLSSKICGYCNYVVFTVLFCAPLCLLVKARVLSSGILSKPVFICLVLLQKLALPFLALYHQINKSNNFQRSFTQIIPFIFLAELSPVPSSTNHTRNGPSPKSPFLSRPLFFFYVYLRNKYYVLSIIDF